MPADMELPNLLPLPLLNDLRYALRSIRKDPAFCAAAVLTLALGIGANTAIFSVIERVLLRPLPYKDPARLVRLWNTYPPVIPQGPNSAGDFHDFQQRAQAFSGMAAFINTPRGLNLTGSGEPQRVEYGYMTSGLLPLLGMEPAAGRNFNPEDDRAPASFTLLISHHLWETRFGLDPSVVGRALTLDGRGYTVVGVLPEELRLADGKDVWMPIGQYDPGPDTYRFHEFNTVARLKPGIGIDQARAELTDLNHQQQQAFPVTHKNFGLVVEALQDSAAAKMRPALLVLFGAVGLVLLVACANFVNLLTMRNAARDRELAVRAALGAGRTRLLRQLLAESLLLSLMGGVLGVFLATAGLRVLATLAPPDLTGMNETGLNLWVLAFTLAISVLSGIGSGLIPALQMLNPDLHGSLKEGMRATGAAGGHTVRRVLVVCEIALAIVPLIGAGLLIRSFERLLEVDPGFRHDHILAMELDRAQPSLAEFNRMTPEQRIALAREQSTRYDELIDRIRTLPGVTAAGGVSVLPLGSTIASASRFAVEGQPIPEDGTRPLAETRNVSPGYFAAMGIPVHRGRLLDDHDYGSQNIVVNETLAQRFWPGGDALGKRIDFCSLTPQPCWATIVGVVGNVHQYGLEGAPTMDTYGAAGWSRYTVIRTASDPAALSRTAIAEIHKFDPDLPVTHSMTLDSLLAESVSPRRFSMFLLGLFAALALLLAAIGVYAVMSYAVRLRTREIGVRMALGARPRNICGLIVGTGARLVVAGTVLGLAGASAVTKLLSSLLYGVTATDPLTFSAVALLLGSVALVACYIPARQAMNVDPITALRRD
jgi:putative ABC transport system permease protein